MCDAADPRFGQGGSVLGLYLGGTHGYSFGSGKFWVEGMEDNIAPN